MANVVLFSNIQIAEILCVSDKQLYLRNDYHAYCDYIQLYDSYNLCAKSVRIRSCSGPYFSTFGLNTEIFGVSLGIESECGKYEPVKLRIRALFAQ